MAKLAVAAGMALNATTAMATQRDCNLRPGHVSVNEAGALFLTGTVSGATVQWQMLCTVSGAGDGRVSAQTCQSWVALATSAQLSGRSLYLIYEDQNEPARANCAAWAPWQVQRVTYLGVTN
jgi:hypothetical protein